MKKITKKICLGLTLAGLCSTQALAGEIICGGTVESLAYHTTDSFMIKLSSMNTPVYFCNPQKIWTVSGTTGETGPETCKMMYSTFLAAKTMKTSFAGIYFDGDEVPTSCDKWESWKPANIRYFEFK
ncbi:MAG: hypothetical protein MJK04_31920 [Psychrosphaera sp.]|nr:hypothetical protein [Psychrosphaera sp.]